MTTLVERAFAEASKLPSAEQKLLEATKSHLEDYERRHAEIT